jgi:hypothetical protein
MAFGPGGKAIKYSSAPATPRQAEYYKFLTREEGAEQDLPAACDRQKASDMIADVLTRNPSLRGRKMGAPGIPKAPKSPKKAAVVVPPPSPRVVYQWPANPLPAVDPLCLPFVDMIPKATEDDLAGYRVRDPYWEMTCDAHADGRFILYVGEAGTGKTTMSKALAHVLQVPWLLISCDGKLNVRTLFGQISIKNGTSFFTEGIFTILSQVPCVVTLAEWNCLDGSVATTFNEVLNNRRLFIAEADGGKGKTYHLHPKCFIVADCNPPGAKYTGAQKSNVASVDRMQVINIPQLTHQEVCEIVGAGPYTTKLADLYLQTNDTIKTNGFRCAITLRGLKRAATLLAKGYTEKDAIELAVVNAIELTGGPDARLAVESVAKSLFKF